MTKVLVQICVSYREGWKCFSSSLHLKKFGHVVGPFEGISCDGYRLASSHCFFFRSVDYYLRRFVMESVYLKIFQDQ